MLAPDLYSRALRFAAHAHGEQRMPGGQLPYVVHLANVAHEVAVALVADSSLDAELAIPCALLHDVLEDTDVPANAVQAAFGDAVLAGARALAKDAALPKEQRMEDSLRRIRLCPREIWIVKLADRMVNLLPPPSTWTPEKIAKYRDEARVIRRALGEASAVLASRLDDRIARYPDTAP